jgi:hypothetical protein
VSVGDARYGRRDNGLVAAAYAAAGDVDPRVGEHLLDVLALEGIAAYLRPSSDLHPVTRSTTLPKRPTDRLYVDREHVRTARAYLARLAREESEAETDSGTPAARTDGTDPALSSPARADPTRTDQTADSSPAGTRSWTEPTSDEVERAFAEIIAGYARTAPGPVLPPAEPRSNEEPPPGLARRKQADEPAPEHGPSLLDGLDTFGADLAEDEDESFVPPEPPPVPRPSLPTVLGVVGVVAGLTIFLKPNLLGFLHESLAMFLGFAAVVSGFGTLIWRLRPGDDDEPDTDDGARV